MKPLLICIALLFVLTGCNKTRQFDVGYGSQVEAPLALEFNNLFELDEFYFSGYPTKDGLRAMANLGVEVIVSMKTPEQFAKAQGFDERAFVEKLGMKIVWIPISPSSFKHEDINTFADVMRSTNAPMLIHCGSANTAGGLWAAYLHAHKGVTLEDAIAQGKSVGLRAPAMIEAVTQVSN